MLVASTITTSDNVIDAHRPRAGHVAHSAVRLDPKVIGSPLPPSAI